MDTCKDDSSSRSGDPGVELRSSSSKSSLSVVSIFMSFVKKQLKCFDFPLIFVILFSFLTHFFVRIYLSQLLTLLELLFHCVRQGLSEIGTSRVYDGQSY